MVLDMILSEEHLMDLTCDYRFVKHRGSVASGCIFPCFRPKSIDTHTHIHTHAHNQYLLLAGIRHTCQSPISGGVSRASI